MASSDDEEEVMPEAVTDYHFVDEKEEPVCFSCLPLLWSDVESLGVHKDQVFLHGKTDDGLQKVYKQVVAWKVDIDGNSPAVSVLSKDKKWLKLLKPRKAYEDTIRKILITLECLMYLKKSPSSSDKLLWEHVRKVFSQFEVRASEDDLLDHLTFIQSMGKRDETLSTSQLLLKFLSELPKKKASTKNNQKMQKSDFINDNDEEEADNNDEDETDEVVDCFDSVCAICDNGGELLCCEGKCLRSFHATKDTGLDSDCKTLGYSRTQVRAIQNFLCPNCVHKKHQCFACGKLGNSDKESGAEVFRCISASCGHFYHPRCVARLLYPKNEAEASALENNIPAGESFLCPVHKCTVCGLFEDKEVEELQFAMCRRCPTSYHRKCLPRGISFGDSESDDEDAEQRAWDGLIPHRILIYCLKHEIDEDIGTPVRDHIIFPGTLESKRVPPTDSSKVKVLAKRKAEDLSRGKNSEKLNKPFERVCSNGAGNDDAVSGSALMSVKKLKTSDTSKKDLKDSTRNVSIFDKKKLPQTTKKVNELEPLKSLKKDMLSTKVGEVDPSRKQLGSIVPLIDDESKKRIMLLVKKSPSSSLTVEDLLKKKQLPVTYAHCTRNVGKTITQGKVEGSIEAVRAALQKFEKGCRIEDAKAVCGPDILNQILSWQKKFKVYLSPFLHGVRYSSYGRHFTKVDKLEEIVEKLHWYVQNGDMIVDFCCGANDFSLLMKRKLEATGKKCSFKNYDLFQPKNDFNFEKRDWMTVRPKELPTGSQLIMGLNPPFGVNAALANKFIDKALEFKPKLLILIVPKETERLDEKPAAYDLIWEDEEKLSGKSFYLPGSVDINDKQIEQWNVKPPLLYLWSRPDWTVKHKAISLKHGHMSSASKEPHLDIDKGQTSVQPEDHSYRDTHAKVIPDLPKEENNRAVGYEEKSAYPNVQAGNTKLENDVDGKGLETAKHNDTGKSQKSHIKLKKKNRKRKSRRQDEIPDNRPAEGASDMSISPPHQTDPQLTPKVDPTLDAYSDGMTGLSRPTLSSQGFGMAYVGERNGSLPKNDINSLERRHARDDVIDNLERSYGRDANDLDRKYAPSSWNGSFSSTSYDLPNTSTGRLNFESRYGRDERFTGYIRGSPLPAFESSAYIGDERRVRTDINGSLRMYGQQEPNDVQRSRHSDSATSPMLPQTVSFSSSYNDVQRSMHSDSATSPMLPQTGSFSSPYGLPGAGIGSSAMNRYAPRLDELNYTAPAPMVPPPMHRPGDSINGMYEVPGSRSSFTYSSQSLFSGHSSSGGWLDG